MDFKGDFWHFPRTELANRLTTAIQYNIMHSYTIFAPRRIGKTYFLNYDLKPALENIHCQVIYYSFIAQIADPINNFMELLRSYLDKTLIKKLGVKQLKFSWCTIDFTNDDINTLNVLQTLTLLAHQAEKENNQLILLLDEIQELVNIPNAKGFIGELRTALDLNKQRIKVIFTGSSREGLRKMFNDKKAPFFHFGANLEMELFDRAFTDFLVEKYKQITKKKIDADNLYAIFLKLNRITLLMREFINVCIVNPNLNLDEAYTFYEKDLMLKNDYLNRWKAFNPTEKVILLGIHSQYSNFYSEDFAKFALSLGYPVTQGKVQNALNKLINNGEVYNMEDGTYQFNDLFMHKWIENNHQDLLAFAEKS